MTAPGEIRRRLTLKLTPAGAEAIAKKIGSGVLVARCSGCGAHDELTAAQIERFLLDGWPETCVACEAAIEIVTKGDLE